MTDVSVSECVSMVHPAPHDGPRPTENPSGPVDDPDGVAVPTPTPTANEKDKSSGTNKGPRHQKPVSHGGPIREAQPRREGPRIHRYSPLGVPNQVKRPGWSGWLKKPNESLKKPNHHITQNTPARLYPHRKLCSRSKWGTRPWNAWYAMMYPEHLPVNYLANLNIGPTWALPPPVISLTPAE